MGVMRVVVGVVAVVVAGGGCAFHRGAVAGDASARDDAAPPLDTPADTAPDAAPPFCDGGDATLVACYAFEGTLADGSPHQLDPDISNNVTYASGKLGQAVVVGPTTEIDVADSADFDVTAFTIEAWIAPAALPATGARAGILDCDGQYGFFLHEAGDLTCTGGGSVSAPAGSVATGTWTHVACTHDGTTLRIYVNGSQVAMAASPAPGGGGTTGITLGGNNPPPNGGSPLDGTLDQLRLFSAARSAGEICADAGQTSCP